MANKVSRSKSAVRAAREAVKASQREVLERTARDAEDLAVFFSSRERLDAVEEWLEAKIAGLEVQAEGKRAEHRRAAGLAVIALRDRGQTLRDVARLTGLSERALRELIRCADGATEREVAALASDCVEALEATPEGAVQAACAARAAATVPGVGPVVGALGEANAATG